jgi:hypothetical protein
VQREHAGHQVTVARAGIHHQHIQVCFDPLKGSDYARFQALAELIGKLVSSFPDVEFGPLHFRCLEALKVRGLRDYGGNFRAIVFLSDRTRAELRWWMEHIDSATRHISHGNPSLVLTTDASKKGWGAVHQGHSTRGRWTPEEACMDINCLELLAVVLGMKCFFSHTQGVHVRARVDNATAMCYINAMGGSKSRKCNDLAFELWQWCIDRDIWVSSSHIAGTANIAADKASRNFNDRIEWQLDTNLFNQITDWLFCPNIDLFASRLNSQLTRYVSWKPDRGAEAFDAFSLDWSTEPFYAFPPFRLIGDCMRKIAEDEAECLLIAPVWPTQFWFTDILYLLCDSPILLPYRTDILMLPGTLTSAQPLRVQLADFHLSGRPSVTEAFRRTLPTSYSHHGVQPHSNNTVSMLRAGRPFLCKGRPIHFNLM